MTAYSVCTPPPIYSGSPYTNFTAPYQLTLTAVSFPIQITKIEVGNDAHWYGQLAPPNSYSIVQYIGTAVSGGAGSITSNPARANAAPSTATSRYGTATVAISGTTGTATSTPVTFTGGTSSELTSAGPYQFPVDYIFYPGSTLVMQGTAVNGSGTTSSLPDIGYYGYDVATIWYEESHLARSR